MAALLPIALQAAGSIGSAYLANQGAGNQTPREQKQAQLIDELLNSVGGNGRFSDVFNADEGAFQRNYVDPAKARFRNQIAPQIQQASIFGGQQRGTALDDQLLRAGVDLDMMLNEQYGNFRQSGLNNQMSLFNSILGQGAGSPGGLSTGQALAQGGAGLLADESFQSELQNLFGGGGGTSAAPMTAAKAQPRAGFTKDWTQWGLGDPRWGQI